MFGATWQARNGFFAGGGINWSLKAEDREDVGVDSDDNFGTKFGWQFRIGYHPGVAGMPVPAAAAPAASNAGCGAAAHAHHRCAVQSVHG